MEMSVMTSYPFPLARQIRGLSGTANEDLSTWRTIYEPALGNDLPEFLKRKHAVIDYLSGATDAALRQRHGLSLKAIYRLIVRRCLRVHRDGLIYGWRGLVRYSHLAPYTRSKPVIVDSAGKGAAGAMSALFALEPELQKQFDKRILTPASDDKLEEKRNRTSHWKWLLAKLRKKGYEIRHEWPFNTESMGYISVCRYITSVLAANPSKGTAVEGGKTACRKMKSGDGVDRPVDHLFQRVEMDAHKLDGRFCVLFPRGDGSYAPRIIHRLWVIVILEVMSRAVLGYYLSFRYEISRDDVFHAIKNALTKWQRRTITFAEFAYAKGAALPSGHDDRYIGACWEETSVDGALAETSKHVRQTLDNLVGSHLLDPKTSFSVRRSPDDRPFIERFFRHLGKEGFQRLTNTTGGNPMDKQGRDPEKIAVNSCFQVEYVEDLLDGLIANYNVAEHQSLGGRSPLEYLDFATSRPGASAIRCADAGEIQRLLSYRKLCTVHGNQAKGRRTYVNFANACYHGDILRQRFDLIGKKIWVENHIEYDARIALAYTIDGESLGILRAAPPWHKTPHSVEVRSAIIAFYRHKRISLHAISDAVQAFHTYCEENHGKLPVHPAYLESLRTLARFAETDVGDKVLEQALAESKDDSSNSMLDGQDKVITVSDQPRELPARRMAATK